MRILIVGDPTPGLKADFDTSLALSRVALARGHHVDWAEPEDLMLADGRVVAYPRQITRCAPLSLPETRDLGKVVPLADYDTVWVRKDPPFDASYLSLCWLLSLEEKNTFFVNKPSLLLRYHEKLLPFEGVARGYLRHEDLVPTWVSLGGRRRAPAGSIRGEVVTKPWLGHGGRGVEKWDSLEAASKGLPGDQAAYTMFQPLLEEVRTMGDHRVFYFNGELIGDFSRFPKAGSIKANIAAGGYAKLVPLTPKQQDLCERIARFLKDLGFVLAGLDIVGDRVSEINVTSPTGFELLKSLTAEAGDPKHPDVMYMDWLEKEVASF